jgi:hypothetical protein
VGCYAVYFTREVLQPNIGLSPKKTTPFVCENENILKFIFDKIGSTYPDNYNCPPPPNSKTTPLELKIHLLIKS